MDSELVLSASAIKTFKDCRMAYKYGYHMNLEVKGNDATEKGTAFHELVAAAARGEDLDASSDMIDVAAAYLAYKPLPKKSMIKAVEDGYWIEVSGVWVRTTYDLVYVRETDGAIVIRDYKTFSKAPTLDLDLDFQSRFYIATAMQHFRTTNVEFEFEYVRSSLYHEGKQSHVRWTPEESYLTYPLVITPREAKNIWDEAGYVIKDIEATTEQGSWYHSDRKGFGGCSSCFYKHICKAENQLGVLDDQTISLLATKREPLKRETN